MPKQPLNYQQQACSCWITSVFNGMVYLLGNADRIPNIVARMLYALSSREGTDNQDAKELINFISGHKSLPIQCDVYEGQAVDKRLIKKLIEDNKVVICDTLSGTHSVLVTGMKSNDDILIFDPDWRNVSKHPLKIEGAFVCDPQATSNVKVFLDYFDQKRTGPKSRFSMGAVKSRFALAMFNKKDK
jgi:hypothetical protein